MYDTFDEYHDKNMNRLNRLKNNFETSRIEVEKELINFFGNLQRSKFYTFANDCERCT